MTAMSAPPTGVDGALPEAAGDPAEVLEQALERLKSDRRWCVEPVPEPARSAFEDDRAVYLRGFFLAETQIAQRLLRLLNLSLPRRKWDAEKICNGCRINCRSGWLPCSWKRCAVAAGQGADHHRGPERARPPCAAPF